MFPMVFRLKHVYSSIMKPDWKTRVLLSAVVLSASTGILVAATPGRPYEAIVDRNIFGLRPPTPPPAPPENKPPPGNITLTGITTILGNKRALLHVSTPARPGEAAKEENFMLTEGQRDGNIEVLEIDERAGSVKVNNAGQVTTLSFEKNGAKLMASAAPTTAAGGTVPMPIPGPGGSLGNPGTRAIPTRNVRGGQQNPSATEVSANAGFGQSGAPTPPITVDPDVQNILIEAQRMHFQEKGDDTHKIFPVTEFTPGFSDTESPAPY
jgi:hypothetical protein